MDYPQLNLLFGLALVLAASLSVGLTALLPRLRELPAFGRLPFFILILSLLPSVYIFLLFFESMTPAFNIQMGLGMLLIGVGVFSLVSRLAEARLSSVGEGWLLILWALSILTSITIAVLLYRSLVPEAIF